MIPARISIVTLGVRDLASMRAFYRTLGWHEGISTEGFAAFKTGGAVLALFPVGELARDANTAAAPPAESGGFRGVTLALNVEEKAQVDEVIAGAGGRRAHRQRADRRRLGWTLGLLLRPRRQPLGGRLDARLLVR